MYSSGGSRELWARTFLYANWTLPAIFPSIFLQQNGSKNSVLNCIMTLSPFMFFFFFLFETLLKDFPVYSPILLTLWFRYLQKSVKESFMYFSSQLFFKTPHKTLKSQGKSKKNAFFSILQTWILKTSVSTIGQLRWATELSKQYKNESFGKNGCKQLHG